MSPLPLVNKTTAYHTCTMQLFHLFKELRLLKGQNFDLCIEKNVHREDNSTAWFQFQINVRASNFKKSLYKQGYTKTNPRNVCDSRECLVNRFSTSEVTQLFRTLG